MHFPALAFEGKVRRMEGPFNLAVEKEVIVPVPRVVSSAVLSTRLGVQLELGRHNSVGICCRLAMQRRQSA